MSLLAYSDPIYFVITKSHPTLNFHSLDKSTNKTKASPHSKPMVGRKPLSRHRSLNFSEGSRRTYRKHSKSLNVPTSDWKTDQVSPKLRRFKRKKIRVKRMCTARADSRAYCWRNVSLKIQDLQGNEPWFGEITVHLQRSFDQ